MISIYITEFKSVLPQNNFFQSNFAQSDISQTHQSKHTPPPNTPPSQTAKILDSTLSQALKSIKNKIACFMFLNVLSSGLGKWAELVEDSEQNFGLFLYFIAFCVFTGSLVVLYLAMKPIWQMAKSKILKKNVKVYIEMNILSCIIINIILWAIEADKSIFGIIFLCILLLNCLIYFIILRYRIYKEIAYITNQPLFMWAFWLGATIFLLPFAVIVYIVAWIMVKEIRKSMSAGEYENKAVESNTDSVKWF